MSTTLTIRHLEEPVKPILRMQAASDGRSKKAEARDIPSHSVKGFDSSAAAQSMSDERPSKPKQTTPCR